MSVLFLLAYAWLAIGYTAAVMIATECMIFTGGLPDEEKPNNGIVALEMLEMTLKGPFALQIALNQVRAATIQVAGDDEDEFDE